MCNPGWLAYPTDPPTSANKSVFFFGADYMALGQSVFAGDEVNNGKPYDQKARHTFNIPTGNIYLEAR